MEHFIPAPDHALSFSTIRQGTATNQLTKIKPKQGVNLSMNIVTGDATVTQGDMAVFIEQYNNMTAGLRVSTYKLLDALTVALTESGTRSPLVRLSLAAYMEKCGLKDRKEARRQIKADMEALSKLRISFKERRGNQIMDFMDVYLFGGERGIRNGVIFFSFSRTFYEILKGYPVMPYHNALFAINPQYNPYSYGLGRRILEHKNMNVGKKNENTISVRTLINATDLPAYEEVMASGRQVDQQIIAPFERDLNALSVMMSWEYCHSNGVQLTEEEVKRFHYDVFIECLVKIHWISYPER